MLGLTHLCPLISVSSLPGVGRCALAARDIEAGEVVMEDEAVMVAPGGGRRVCLECGAGVAEELSCPECGLPVCCSGQGARVVQSWKIGFPTILQFFNGVKIILMRERIPNLALLLQYV